MLSFADKHASTLHMRLLGGGGAGTGGIVSQPIHPLGAHFYLHGAGPLGACGLAMAMHNIPNSTSSYQVHTQL